ncbi:MAG: DUF4097 domain-containing protein [Clostridiales bacterium]|nr:DUF4097 domain-containing protein [Clostridiales bacterium]
MKTRKFKNITLGCVTCFCFGLSLVGFSSCKESFTMREDLVADAFENITIDTKTVDIDFMLATDGECRVITPERAGLQYTVIVQDGTLRVKLNDTRKWYQYIRFKFETPSVTVYLPDAVYKNLTIDSTTGDINIPQGLSFENVAIDISTGDVECDATVTGNMKIETSTGDIEVGNAMAKSVEVSTTTGDIEIENTQAGDMVINVTTGDVELDNVTCTSLTTEGDTGDFTADNVKTAEMFYVKRTTGKVIIQKITAGALTVDKTTGKMDISTAVCGDVQLSVTTGSAQIADMTCANFTSTGSTGDLTMDNVVASGKFTMDRNTGDITFNGCDAGEIEVETTTGSVTGTLLSEKIFIARSTSGRVDTPETLTGGKCKITTTSGKIKIEIKSN